MISNPIPVLWFVGGCLLGLVHAISLWDSSKSPNSLTALVGILRLFIVAAGLLASAVFGGILATALGWAIAFFLAVVVTFVRSGVAQTRYAKKGTSS